MIKVKNIETDEVVEFTPNELLKEINRDRTEGWQDYTTKDISTEHGLLDALTMTEYQLLEYDTAERGYPEQKGND